MIIKLALSSRSTLKCMLFNITLSVNNTFVTKICVRIIEFSRDVTAAMLGYKTNSLGIELYYHANVFLCFGGKTRLLIT